jgi:hypothetical protein
LTSKTVAFEWPVVVPPCFFVHAMASIRGLDAYASATMPGMVLAGAG